MNRVSPRSKESARSTVEPHAARRAIRQQAADNTQKAILFQFPGLLGAQPSAVSYAARQAMSNTQGGDDVAQAA